MFEYMSSIKMKIGSDQKLIWIFIGLLVITFVYYVVQDISLLYLLLVLFIVASLVYGVIAKFKSTFKPGIIPSGLRNTNETCYMNAMIQALASSEPTIKYYEELIKDCNNDECCSKLRMLLDVLNGINQSDTSVNRTHSNTALLLSLMNSVRWNRASQQDAFQLLSFFINAIQKDIKDFLIRKNMTMAPKLQILHTFTQDPKFNKVQDHLALALPLCGTFMDKPGVQLETILDAFFEPSIIDDGPEKTQMYLFKSAPDVMILHIQANEWSSDLGNYIKPRYYICYDETFKYKFTIHKHINESQLEIVEVEYELLAVVHHMGDVSGGHYITYRKCGDKWYLTNDEQVEEIHFNYDVVPYIMVYKKIETDKCRHIYTRIKNVLGETVKNDRSQNDLTNVKVV